MQPNLDYKTVTKQSINLYQISVKRDGSTNWAPLMLLEKAPRAEQKDPPGSWELQVLG